MCGCMGMWGNSCCGGDELSVLQALCVCLYVCKTETVTGLNLPVGDVIKAPHTAGSDGGSAVAAAWMGININQACIKETTLQSESDLHPNN